MQTHVDVLEERDSLNRPLMISALVHGAVFAVIAVNAALGSHGGDQWGNPNGTGGNAVAISPVSRLPLPARSGNVNPLANDTESRAPLPPKPQPKSVKAPPPDAIELPARNAPKKPTYRRQEQYSQYRPQPDRPNQLYSSTGQAMSSNMFGAQSSSGSIGAGFGGSFGNRFGYYRDLLEQRIGQHWHTEDVDQGLQKAPLVGITFEIQRDGSLRNVRILQSSGIPALDRSAQRAIYEAVPLPPLPQGYERSSAQVEFWFELKR